MKKEHGSLQIWFCPWTFFVAVTMQDALSHAFGFSLGSSPWFQQRVSFRLENKNRRGVRLGIFHYFQTNSSFLLKTKKIEKGKRPSSQSKARLTLPKVSRTRNYYSTPLSNQTLQCLLDFETLPSTLPIYSCNNRLPIRIISHL